MEVPRVCETYSGRKIFITGGTGFLGKLLVEKLLRSCSDLCLIYLLVRGRRGRTAQQRWQELTQNKVFDRLRREKPGLLEDKVHILQGDVKELQLGLNPEDLKTLKENVNIIFHVAATVRFDEPFSEAVLMNTRGTHELVKIALEAQNLEAFVHVSTTFINCPTKRIEEKFYPPLADWRRVIRAVENLDATHLHILQAKYMKNCPNTYIFTKNLGESIISDYQHQLPVIIMRPSIVVSTQFEPFSGWLDNLNGPVGLTVIGSKGLLRVAPMDADPELLQPLISGDEVTQALLLGPWSITQLGKSGEVYNVTSSGLAQSFLSMTRTSSTAIGWTISLDMLWYPQFSEWQLCCRKTFAIQAPIFHLFSGLILDQLISLFKLKPINLTKIQIKIHRAIIALKYFMQNSLEVKNDQYIQLCKKVGPLDLNDFSCFSCKPDLSSMVTDSRDYILKYILKEDTDQKDYVKKAVQKCQRFYCLDKLVQALFYGAIGYTLHNYTTLTQCVGFNF